MTTVCVNAMQLPDNCYELQILRNFRDEYIASKTNGTLIIAEYYETAPKIISAINSTGNGNKIFRNLYPKIKEAVFLIEQNKFEDAYKFYCNFADQLRRQYLV
ncbi:MAG TPA: CFI-box-CTERM domain-containing protein [Mucilaginibacter sp.]